MTAETRAQLDAVRPEAQLFMSGRRHHLRRVATNPAWNRQYNGRQPVQERTEAVRRTSRQTSRQ
jgi:hypothetical protein